MSFLGLLPREDIKSLLRSNGDFVVTVTESVPGQPQEFVLSVMMQPAKGSKRIRHYTYKQVDGKVCIDTQTFDSIVSSIDHFLNKGESVIESGDKVILRTPISRCDWELTQEEIEITKKLGEGAFGEVSLGKLSRKSSNEVLNVAIKSSKLKALTKDQVSDIMYEARIMRMFEHPNVIKIHGVSALKEPIMLVLELASDGALDSYLRKNTVSVQAKGEMCCGASFGLEYLHHVCNVIHRKLYFDFLITYSR
jgi:serine/threonine protein kinase